MYQHDVGSEHFIWPEAQSFAEIRTAHPADDSSVSELLVRASHETYARRSLSGLNPDTSESRFHAAVARRRSGLVRVAELGFQIIGTYALAIDTEVSRSCWRPTSAWLSHFAIDPRFGATELASRLFEDLTAISKREGIRSICTRVASGAKGMTTYYRAAGFSRDYEGDQFCDGWKADGYFLNLIS